MLSEIDSLVIANVEADCFSADFLERGDFASQSPLRRYEIAAGYIPGNAIRLLTCMISHGGLDVNYVPDGRPSLMRLALVSKNYTIVKLFVENGAKLPKFDSKASYEIPCSDPADVYYKKLRLARTLMDRCNLKHVTCACRRHHPRCAQNLASLRNPIVTTKKVAEDFKHAIVYFDVPVIMGLLNRGVDANMRFADGSTPLWCAVRLNSPVVVKALLEAGADPNLETPQGSPIEYLARNTVLCSHITVQRFA